MFINLVNILKGNIILEESVRGDNREFEKKYICLAVVHSQNSSEINYKWKWKIAFIYVCPSSCCYYPIHKHVLYVGMIYCSQLAAAAYGYHSNSNHGITLCR